MTSALFSPIKLADLQLANRIAVSPMCQYSANDGVADDWHMTHLGMLANSGASFLVVEATHVEPFNYPQFRMRLRGTSGDENLNRKNPL